MPLWGEGVKEGLYHSLIRIIAVVLDDCEILHSRSISISIGSGWDLGMGGSRIDWAPLSISLSRNEGRPTRRFGGGLALLVARLYKLLW